VGIQIYNKEEARNSRIFLGVVLGAIFLFGAYEAWSAWRDYELTKVFSYPVSWGDVVGLVFVVVGAVVTFVVVNTPKVVDFCSSVESELLMASWPTGRQVMNATIVVLVTMAVMTVVLLVWDRVITIPLSYLGLYQWSK